MAGHSKWANIQHRKGRQDKLRSKLFSKLAKDIAIASKMGGPDPDMNPRLRLAINNAKGQSMPKDNIKRAVDKGAGGDSADYQELRYEGFGPSGIGIVVEVSTDNTNRSAMEVRTAFSKNGGNMGETGWKPARMTYSLINLTKMRMTNTNLFTHFTRPVMIWVLSHRLLRKFLAKQSQSTLFGVRKMRLMCRIRQKLS